MGDDSCQKGEEKQKEIEECALFFDVCMFFVSLRYLVCGV